MAEVRSTSVVRLAVASILTAGLIAGQSLPVADAEAATKAKTSGAKRIAERKQQQKSAPEAPKERKLPAKAQARPVDDSRRSSRTVQAPLVPEPSTSKDAAPAKEPPRQEPPAAASSTTAAPVPAKPHLAAPASIDAPAWTDQDVITALSACVEILAPLGADVKVSKPLRDGTCGAPAPVLLKRIGSVEITPPAVVTCPIVGALHTWIHETLEPATREMLGSAPRRIVSLSGYSCRNRIGTSNEKISEHAVANAIDIGAIVTQDGQTVDVLSGWGETLRDARRSAQADTKAAGGGAGGQDGAAEPRSSAGGGRPEAKGAVRRGSSETRVADASRVPRPVVPDAPASDHRKKRDFLQRLHDGACGVFTTVLGPEANEAHRNHLHFDLAPRKRRAFCE